MEQVSLSEDTSQEWWIVRESTEDYGDFGKYESETQDSDKKTNLLEKSQCLSNDSWSWKTVDPNISKTPGRLSHNFSKLHKSKLSDDFSSKNDSKCSQKSVKSISNPVYKINILQQKNVLSSMEEELYIKGCTAIWSKGINSNSSTLHDTQRVTLCSYTMDTAIRHGLWCKFYLEWPSFTSEEMWNKPEEPNGDTISCICLLDSNNIRVFTEKGEDFRSSLPFLVSSAWNIKYGLLIEREIQNIYTSFHRTTTENEINNPTIYTLLHPLDEMCPVAIKNGNNFQIFNNPNLKLVFTNSDPSICMMYDSCAGQHCVFLIRRLKQHEWDEIILAKSKLNLSSHSVNISQKVSFEIYEIWNNFYRNNIHIYFAGKTHFIGFFWSRSWFTHSCKSV